jgi:hypothetical protein
MLSQIAKASLVSELLIDFNCYVDTEVGLIKLIRNNFLDDSIFDVDKIKGNMRSIILSLIERKEANPLYLFSKDSVNKNDLDDYYKEFMEDEYDNIISLSVTTEINSLLQLFKTEPSIHVTFLCNKQIEIDILKETLKNDNTYKYILEDQDNIDYSKYNTYFFKYIDDRVLKYIYDSKSYYFSTHKLNFGEDNMSRPDIVNKIIANGGTIEIMDLYNLSYLKE